MLTAIRLRDAVAIFVCTALAVGVTWVLGIVQDLNASRLSEERKYCEQVERQALLVTNEQGRLEYECGVKITP